MDVNQHPQTRSNAGNALLKITRLWGPLTLCAAGLAFVVAGGGTEDSLHVGIPIFSAGASVWLLNFLFRIGVSGDVERNSEEAAREFFAAHGRWPKPGELSASEPAKAQVPELGSLAD